MKRLRKVLTGVALLGVAGAVGGAAFVYSGAYDVSAIDQHTKPVYWLIEFTMRRAVAVRARESATPDLESEDKILRGFALYHANCVQCHGGPGWSPQRAALGMMPPPAYLVHTAHGWSAAEIHWVVKNGIKATGMPAWKHRLSDEEMWQVVAFVKHRLPYLSAAQYAEGAAKVPQDAVAPTGERETIASSRAGDPHAGRKALDQYLCATCHVIPRVTAATKQVGPPLTDMANRSYIAGALANTDANMVRWLMSPPRVKPGTAMPDLGVSEQDARDMAAYLGTLKSD